ncbi:hypothetical protein [Bacillus safensis]|uniref:hypothetical protein n=1 Tax=Bacillus safensis TaxID=561879 RepID=UPI002452CEF2|nr:hypothetical protein [Bacillus safensis]MDH3096428.1 hypothetical protein [Bacillus safensis]
MSTIQTSVSVQNDGNFSHLDFFDPTNNLLRRIEVFRCSQPYGTYGVTAPGSNVKAICGKDHLSSKSNLIYRSYYSEGQKTAKLPLLLEIREEKNINKNDGSWDVRIRDLDAKSKTFGFILRITVTPSSPPSKKSYLIKYEVRREDVKPVTITSPLTKEINEIVPGLPDIGLSDEYFREEDLITSVEFTLSENSTKQNLDVAFKPLHDFLKSEEYSQWRENVYGVLRLGNLGPKSVHPAVNLIGPNPNVVAESVTVRGYRSALVLSGRAFEIEEMARATSPMNELHTRENYSLPGVYNLYIMAYKLNISLYKLILDKMESDYGGIPMALRPGSRLENNRTPIFDATNAIKTISDISEKYYLL